MVRHEAYHQGFSSIHLIIGSNKTTKKDYVQWNYTREKCAEIFLMNHEEWFFSMMTPYLEVTSRS